MPCQSTSAKRHGRTLKSRGPPRRRKSFALPATETGEPVGATALECSGERLPVEIERAQQERRRWREELNVHAWVLEARQLRVALDLVNHAHLERLLERSAQTRGRATGLARRVAHHDHGAANRHTGLERLQDR